MYGSEIIWTRHEKQEDNWLINPEKKYKEKNPKNHDNVSKDVFFLWKDVSKMFW